jgi:DNA-binding SARP family transcriptional activator/predicted ATPase/Tfp pilus assembly protein PilF
MPMNRLSLTLFGGFAAETQTGTVPHFTTDKVRALLAYLALRPDSPLRREALAGILWPDYPESLARQNLRQTLSRLRKSVDEAQPGLGEALLDVSRQAVALQGRWCSADAALYWEHLQAVDDHRHGAISDCPVCLVRLEEAVALYRRGDFLAGLSLPDAPPFEEWLLQQREQLYQRQLAALEQLALAYEKQGAFEAAYRHAMWQIEIEPWREKAHRQVMRLLANNGQRSQALAHYESCRQILADELGVEPEAETRELWQQIKEEALRLPAARRTRTHHFPSQLTPFVGREEVLAEIVATLADKKCRVLSVIGPSGMGKTRLSIQVGLELARVGPATNGPAAGGAEPNSSDAVPYYPDGAYFVPLAAVTDSERLATAIAQGLQLQLDEDVSPRRQLLSYLPDKDLLLVCDNFEQVTEGALLMAEIVAVAPRVQVLLTSQQPLNIQAECRYSLGGMDYAADGQSSEAVQLFVSSARRVAPEFQLAPDDYPAVMELCQLLDGMPLALVIAAAWVRMMDCQAIFQETRRSLDFLISPLADTPARHQSVRAVLARSWQSLPDRLQAALRQIALFSGGFTLEAARAIMPGLSVVDMAALLDRSLVSWRPDSRYEMHQLPRHFARQQEQPGGRQDEEVLFRSRYCRYYLGLAADQGALLRGPNPRQAIGSIQRDLDNIHQAWQWALEDRMYAPLIGSLGGLGRFYHLVGLFEEAEQRFLTAQSLVSDWQPATGGPATGAPSTERDALQLHLHLQQSHFLGQSGQYLSAVQHAQGAQELARQFDTTDLLAQALGLEGEWRRQLNQLEPARSCLEAAAVRFTTPSRNPGFAHVLDEIGQLHLIQSQYDAALSAFNRARQIYEAVGDRTEMSTTLGNLAEVYRQKADYAQAMTYSREALAVAEAIGYKQAIVRISIVLGTIQMEQGDIEPARSTYLSALEIARTLGYMRGVIDCHICLGMTHAAQGQLDEADQWYQTARLQAEEVGLQDLIASVAGRQGILHAHRGEHEAAIAAYRQAVQLWRLLNNQAELGRNLSNLGNIYLRLGRYDRALEYYEQALGAMQAVGARQQVANTMLKLGNVFKRTGDYDRAVSYFEQSLEIHRAMQHKGGMALSLGWLGLMHNERGQFEEAWGRYEQAMALSREMGDQINMTVWLMNQAEVAMFMGRRGPAERLAQQSVDLARTLGTSRFLPSALIHQAEVHFTFGGYEQARLQLAEALRLGESMGDQQMLFDARLLQAQLKDRLGEREEAVDQLRAMAGEFPGDDYQARIHHYLWEIGGDETARETALGLYEELLARTPSYRLRQQWNKLRES